MPARMDTWLTAQEAAAEMKATSADICRLLSLGRLNGIKRKQPGRAGKAQWLVEPKSVAKEKRRLRKIAAQNPNRRRPGPRP